MSKKVLVLGASGAMGQYLVPKLAERGYDVDAIALESPSFHLPNVTDIGGNAKDWNFLEPLLARNYDGIVDFLIYSTRENPVVLPEISGKTGHYIYLSSYRIYDNKEVPVKETSPRLLDTADDPLVRESDDYCAYKARGENIMRSLPRKNWTIIRPAITYSFMRYQLVTLEAPNNVGRAFAGKTVIVPEAARNKQATMSWAGDVAEMIARLLFNEKAFGETFTVATSEHHTWGEITDYYKEICNLNALWIDKEEFIHTLVPNSHDFGYRWQLNYDRLFERVIDNSKVLAATGLRQSELMPLFDGLKYEIGRCPRDYKWPVNEGIDAYLSRKGLK